MDSKVISAYLELVMQIAYKVWIAYIHTKVIPQYIRLPQEGKNIMCFDPSFLPSFKCKGYQGVKRYSKVCITYS